jgi:molybdate transport system substrate-binding protein
MTSAPLRLLSSMATREILAALIALYQRTNPQAIAAEAGGGVDVAKRIQNGEAVDVVVLAGNVIDRLIADGSLLAGSRVDLAQSGVAVAVRSGAPPPAIATEAEVRSAVLAAKSLSFSTGPSGLYLEKMFERWGVLAQLRSRIVVPPPGVPVGSLVAEGRVELGFQQLSELLPLAGITVVGPLPAGIQSITTFSGGVATSSGAPAAARALLEFMASPAVAAVKQRLGMESAS